MTLLNKLAILEANNVFLYDTGAILYFMDTENEKKLKLFYSKGDQLKKDIEAFCDYFMKNL